MHCAVVLGSLLAAAGATISGGTTSAAHGDPKYLAAAIAGYEQGENVHHKFLPAPDEWSLAAALIAKHTRNTTWVRRATAGLEGFTDAWGRATRNGTATPFGYKRSGFTGWSLPLAYKVLGQIGHEPRWAPARLDAFKRALDSWLSPKNTAAASGGLLELGNWNKGFQHLADAAAVVDIFPDVDGWPHNGGLYHRYVNRTWHSWADQHCYPENSVGYNGITMRIVVNALPMILPRALADLHSPLTQRLLASYAGFIDPTGCMPAYGASNTKCEDTPGFMSAFEGMAAVTRDPGLRYAAQVCAEHAGNTDPISSMFAYDQGDAALAVMEGRSAGGTVNLRVEARNQEAEGALLPDKMVLAAPNVSLDATVGGPWVMMELWAALSLYHEDTPQIVGDIVEISNNRTVYTIETGRKHSPDIAQGNSLLLLPSSDGARRSFPWFGSAGLVPEPASWQEFTTSTRFLQPESNDMGQYTTRHIKRLNITCDATVAADLSKGFDVQIYKVELLGPRGGRTLEDFPTAYPGASLSDDVPTGSTGKSLLLHCAANTSTVVSRPGAPFDLTFDVVEDYTHVRFHWKASAGFKFSEGIAGSGLDSGSAAIYPMPLSLDLTYPTLDTDCHKDCPLGDISAGDFGAHGGGFEESWFYPVASSAANETSASSDAAGNSGGLATIRHMWGFGTIWRRGLVLLRQGLLAVVDDISLGPTQQASGEEYIAGPVFALNSGFPDGPHKLPSTAQQVASGSYWDLRRFANNDSLLVVMTGAELANSTLCNILAGAASCRPDVGVCNRSATGRRGATMCPHTSVFGYKSVSGSARSTVVTLMVPHSLEALTPAKVGELRVTVDGEAVAVELGGWGEPHAATPAPKRVSFDLGSGRWAVKTDDAAAPPGVTISNGKIVAKLYLPEQGTGFYQGTRFDWAGLVYSLKLGGHDFYGSSDGKVKWFNRTDPIVRDFIYSGDSEITSGPCSAAMGPVDDFGAIGFDEAKSGESFLKVGIGALRKPEGATGQDDMTLYNITDPGKWAHTLSYANPDRAPVGISFTQEVSVKSGYAFSYNKTLSMTEGKAEMVIAHSLKNTGAKLINISVFTHNFLVLDDARPGPPMTVTVPYQIQTTPGRPNKTLASVEGNQVKYLQTLQGKETVSSHLDGFGATAADNQIQIENSELGAGMKITGSEPLIGMNLWSVRSSGRLARHTVAEKVALRLL
jgi:hypothetical protein